MGQRKKRKVDETGLSFLWNDASEERMMKRAGIGFFMLGFCLALSAGMQARAGEPKTPVSLRSKATIETSSGSFEIELFDDDAPRTVDSFIKLAEKNFFDGLRVHRVVTGTLMQTGDEKTKDPLKVEEWGTGGKIIPGKEGVDDISASNSLYQDGYQKGMVVMANRGPRTGTSQFMVLLKDLPFWPKNYVIFGKVTRGLDVALSIGNVELVPVLGPDDGRPKTDVLIKSVNIKTRPSPKLMQVSDPGK